ncbi:monoamine oxidase [Acrasis kona]|uniref:Amine oxidase n=1 Tax=Acrasis kona TaxID=1008807 RepID=A0AAW2YQG2_9EUKA
MLEHTYDIIVVGGGLAGLYASKKLIKEGHSVLVLEARDRVGGRTLTEKHGDHYWDLGGQWVGGTHYLLQDLVKELGLEMFDQYEEGDHILDVNGKQIKYAGNISNLNDKYSLDGVFEAIQKLDTMAFSLPSVSDPLSGKPNIDEKQYGNPKTWDSQTIAEWTSKNVKGDDGRAIINWFARVCLGQEPLEMSLLYFLVFLKAGEGYSRLADIKGGAQEKRIVNGSQQVSTRLKELLEKNKNFDIKLNSTVHRIEQHPTAGVSVTVWNDDLGVKDQRVYKAKYCIVAVPPTISRKIDFYPLVSGARDELTQRMPMGCIIKVIVVYKNRFWREKGFSAEVISDTGPIFICYDDSAPDGTSAIVGFIGAQAAREWATRTEAERQSAICKQYARYWGEEALHPIKYLEKDWRTERHSGGCYVGLLGPGAITACHKGLREPCGRIHWAGTETASKWIAYMEGALESGERVAKEVSERVYSSNDQLKSKL